MQTISKSKLRAKMLEIFRKLESSKEELIVTDRGRPVLKIIPITSKSSVDELFGAFQGKVLYNEDPTAPTLDEWEET